MGIFAVYLLKSAIALSIFYLFFKVLLSKETFHRFNRIALLLVVVSSLLLPLTPLQISFIPNVQSFFQEIEDLGNTQIEEEVIAFNEGFTASSVAAEMVTESKQLIIDNEILTIEPISFLTDLPLIQIIIGVWLLGAILRFLIFIRSLFQTISIIKTKPTFEISAYKVIILPVCRTPFSWWRYIVMSQADYDEHGEAILTHEKAHLEAHHSYDILLSEILICIQWFNPTAYLVKQELQSIHEYEADTSVLKQGINATQYQLLLVKKAVDSSSYTLANSFNHSSLKKRITMMLKNKSNQRARIKAFAFLPLAILLVSAFARTEVNAENIDNPPTKVTESLDIEQITSVKDTEDITFTTTDTNGQKIMATASTIIMNDVEFKKGTNSKISIQVMDDKKKKQIPLSPALITSSDVLDTIMALRIHGIDSLNTSNKPLIVINGVEIISNMGDIDPSDIKSIDILKNTSSTVIYGSKGANGVVLITTKKGYKNAPQESKKRMSSVSIASSSASSTKTTIRIRGIDSLNKSNKPLIIIDNVLQNDIELSSNFDSGTVKEEGFGTLTDIIPSDIQSISVLKDTSATAIYGAKGANGVVLITTKEGSKNALQKKKDQIPPPPPLIPQYKNHKGNFLVLSIVTYEGIDYHNFLAQNASTKDVDIEYYHGSAKKPITVVSKKLINHILKEMGLNKLIENGEKVEFIKGNKTVQAEGMSKEEIYNFFGVTTN